MALRNLAIAMCLGGLGLMPLAGQETRGRLEFADEIRMVSCDPAAGVPCFRIKLNIVDGQGKPLGLQLPAPDKLAASMTVKAGEQEFSPFYATIPSDATVAMRGRVALILIDISGSMNRVLASGPTRFDAAKSALEHYLSGFQDGLDEVAIVAFESHGVVQGIKAAKFASTKDEALQQVSNLPAPKPKNNTGLYSAVDMGLDVLKQKLDSMGGGAGAPEGLLVVMTDGANEVFKGDDPGLLAGDEGLNIVANRVTGAGINVVGVGFGDVSQIDEKALSRLSTKYYMASDLEGLKKIFTMTRTVLRNRVQATFASPWADRASLAGRSMHVIVKLKLPTGETLTSAEKIWETPQVGVPLMEGKCEAPELLAAIHLDPPSGSGWMALLRPVLVFAGLGVLLLILWFWVPWLVWPERYMGVAPSSARWAEQAQPGAGAGKPAGPAPAGFGRTGPGGVRPPARAPMDKTVLYPRPDMTRTRLEVRPDKDAKS